MDTSFGEPEMDTSLFGEPEMDTSCEPEMDTSRVLRNGHIVRTRNGLRPTIYNIPFYQIKIGPFLHSLNI